MKITQPVRNGNPGGTGTASGSIGGDVTGTLPGGTIVRTVNGLPPTWKNPVRVATTTAGTLATSFENGDTIDGVVLVTTDRILIKNQASGLQNGIYIVNTTGAPTRAVDMNQADEVVGSVIYVLSGTTNAGTIWVNTNATAPVLETTAITFVAFATTPTGDFVLKIEGGQETINVRGTLGATETVDPTSGNIITGTLDQNCTITISAPTGAGGSTLEWWLTESGGSFTPTFSPTAGTFTWDGGITPTFPASGQTFRVVTERIPGTANDWIGNMVGSGAASFATPAIVLGTAAAAGVATTVIRSDSTIVAFDTTVPEPIGTASAGSVALAARRNHVHPITAATIVAAVPQHAHVNNVVFSGDGAATVFTLPVSPVDANSVGVYVTAARSQDWTLSGVLLDVLTFGTAPPSAANNIVIDIAAALA